jgi:guanosine-3',5'-bis(diphosphate) 3'-pyrophosphohydrolase
MKSKFQKAMDLAIDRHSGQFRKYPGDDIPYVKHCLSVAARTALYIKDWKDHPKQDILSASVLHDVLEDTDTTFEELRDLFGEHVANLVQELTIPAEVKGRAAKYRYFYSFRNKSVESIVIKIADRMDNVEDFLLSDYGKLSYGREYALQAYPLIRAFTERIHEMPSSQTLFVDLCNLDDIIQKRYPDISIQQKNEAEILEALGIAESV